MGTHLIGQISQINLVISGVLCFYLITYVTPIPLTKWNRLFFGPLAILLIFDIFTLHFTS